jgi:hypothetical protein
MHEGYILFFLDKNLSRISLEIQWSILDLSIISLLHKCPIKSLQNLLIRNYISTGQVQDCQMVYVVSNQKSQFGSILEGLILENVVTFYGL